MGEHLRELRGLCAGARHSRLHQEWLLPHWPRALRPCCLPSVKICWRMGKDTGGEKAEGAMELKTNDAAGIVLVPQQPMVVDTFDNCEGLARIAFLDGNSAVMLGKVSAVNLAKDWD